MQLFRAQGTSDLLWPLPRARRSFTLVIHSARTLHCRRAQFQAPLICPVPVSWNSNAQQIVPGVLGGREQHRARDAARRWITYTGLRKQVCLYDRSTRQWSLFKEKAPAAVGSAPRTSSSASTSVWSRAPIALAAGAVRRPGKSRNTANQSAPTSSASALNLPLNARHFRAMLGCSFVVTPTKHADAPRPSKRSVRSSVPILPTGCVISVDIRAGLVHLDFTIRVNCASYPTAAANIQSCPAYPPAPSAPPR